MKEDLYAGWQCLFLQNKTELREKQPIMKDTRFLKDDNLKEKNIMIHHVSGSTEYKLRGSEIK